MKLFYSPGACSLAPHIALQEAGLAHEAMAAPTKTHTLADGTDYYTINPLGYVPLLVLDDGRQLREVQAIVQYIADLAPASGLAPANGTYERYKLQEWLSFIATELHKGCFAALFAPAMPAEGKEQAKTRLLSRLQWLEAELGNQPYLMGDTFTVADGYLFVVLNWARLVGVDVTTFATLKAFMERVRARPAVKAALRAEGLLK